jgi:hypothetical protein
MRVSSRQSKVKIPRSTRDFSKVDDIAFAKAKNWLGGITALLGLVTTAAVLAAPAAKDLGDGQRNAVVIVASFFD